MGFRKKNSRKVRKKSIEIDITWLLVGVLALVLAFMFIRGSLTNSSSTKATGLPLFVPSKVGNSAVFGDPTKADVVIFEYSDFACPACQYFAATTFPKLKSLIESGEIAYVAKYFIAVQGHKPLAEPAIVVAECVRKVNPEKYWEFRDAVFGYLSKGVEVKELDNYYQSLVKLAQLPTAHQKEVWRCVEKYKDNPAQVYAEDQSYVLNNIAPVEVPLEYIKSNPQIARQQPRIMLDVLGTPFFVLCKGPLEENHKECTGYPVIGAVSYESLKQIIDTLKTN